jgi:hypothetical protein
MKILCLLALDLLIFSSGGYSQDVKEMLRGDWIGVGISGKDGKPAAGKYGQSSDYIKFSFKGNKMTITEAPFDRGLPVSYVVTKGDIIDWFPTARYDLPERMYKIKSLNRDSLALATKYGEDSITYHFVNQKRYDRTSGNDNVIDNGLIVVGNLKATAKTKGSNKVFEYVLTNDPMFRGVSPLFDDPSFGFALANKITLPSNFVAGKMSEELTLEFNVSEDGASNFTVVRSLEPELDAEVIRVMASLAKKWLPVIVNDKPVTTRSRMHLYFYLRLDR